MEGSYERMDPHGLTELNNSLYDMVDNASYVTNTAKQAPGREDCKISLAKGLVRFGLTCKKTTIALVVMVCISILLALSGLIVAGVAVTNLLAVQQQMRQLMSGRVTNSCQADQMFEVQALRLLILDLRLQVTLLAQDVDTTQSALSEMTVNGTGSCPPGEARKLTSAAMQLCSYSSYI